MTLSETDLSRRTVLAALAATSGLVSAGLGSPALAALPNSDKVLLDHVLRIFSSRRSVDLIGLACCDQKGFSDRHGLIEAIFGPERERLALLSHAEIHEWLREKIIDDFCAGRTETVSGWVLSGTEARVYALASLA
jgi:hypothetical protein